MQDSTDTTQQLHVFDVSDREGIMGDLKVMLAESKEDAQSMMADKSLQSEFDKHAEEIEENTYVSATGEDLIEKDMFAHLDGGSLYDGVEYLGTFDEAVGEMMARLSTGRARNVMFYEPAREHVDLETLEELRECRDVGREVSA